MANFLKSNCLFTAAFLLVASAAAASYEALEESSGFEQLKKSQPAGVSLMQSGRSVFAPPVGPEKLSGFHEGSLDEFAAIEDEFDHDQLLGASSSSLEKAGGSPKQATQEIIPTRMPEHFGEPLLYIETLIVILTFAGAASLFRRFGQHLRSQKRQQYPPTPLPTPAATAPSAVPSAVEEAAAPGASPPFRAVFALTASEGFSILEQAVRSGDEEKCKEALENLGARAAVRMEDSCGCTALHTAADCGSVGMIQLLLNYGARVDSREAWDETALHFAARSGCVEACEALLAAGADINAANLDGVTPLLTAGFEGKEAVCELLLDRGAGVAGAADSELPPLLSALLVRRMFAAAATQPAPPSKED